MFNSVFEQDNWEKLEKKKGVGNQPCPKIRIILLVLSMWSSV